MPETSPSRRPRSLAAAVVLVAAIVILAGALLGFVPFLRKQQHPKAWVADAVAPHANLSTSAFVLAPHQRACMDAVAFTPKSAQATFLLASTAAAEHEGPPLELLLAAPGYRALANLPAGGYSMHVAFDIRPPRRPVIGTACVINSGKVPVALAGTTALRTTSRSLLTIDGKPVVGNLTFTVLEKHPKSRLAILPDVVEHVSNLTDQLVPTWLVWLLAACLVAGVPVVIVIAFQRAVREDEAATRL
jgi:hypothetical protein